MPGSLATWVSPATWVSLPPPAFSTTTWVLTHLVLPHHHHVPHTECSPAACHLRSCLPWVSTAAWVSCHLVSATTGPHTLGATHWVPRTCGAHTTTGATTWVCTHLSLYLVSCPGSLPGSSPSGFCTLPGSPPHWVPRLGATPGCHAWVPRTWCHTWAHHHTCHTGSPACVSRTTESHCLGLLPGSSTWVSHCLGLTTWVPPPVLCLGLTTAQLPLPGLSRLGLTTWVPPPGATLGATPGLTRAWCRTWASHLGLLPGSPPPGPPAPGCSCPGPLLPGSHLRLVSPPPPG
ncbi:hypothetical protein GPJ56_007216 [Histomonas meleagridis]|nr:hypothetical protein GPJ56_007216 [Histomonas meleagridis]